MHQEAVPNAQDIAGKDKGTSFCISGTCFRMHLMAVSCLKTACTMLASQYIKFCNAY